jgi:transcriptional regulator with XRE-family HTH domain
MKQTLHIGSIIKQISKEKKVSAREIADKLHCCYSNVYDIFRRQSINSEMLQELSKILDYEFSSPQKDQQNVSIMAVIKTNALKFDELLTDSSLEIIMWKQL